MIHKRFAILAGSILGIALLAGGCDKKDDSAAGPAPTALSPVTNLKAYSASATSVGLNWTATTSASSADFSDYQVTVKQGGAVVGTPATVAKTQTATVISGLTEGTIYTFEVVARAVSGSTTSTSSEAATIQWSPAKRLTQDSGLPIKVYETTSSVGGSGLIFYNPAVSGPQAVPQNTSTIDMYVHTEPAGVSMKSASEYNAAWHYTRFSTFTVNTASLDDPQTVPPDTSTFTQTIVTIDSAAVTASRIYYFKGNDGNYGRLLVKMNPVTNSLVWGTSPDQYLNMEISYQSMPYVRFAKTK